MSNPLPLEGWPRSSLDSGTPRRTMVPRHPKPAYISLTRVAHSKPNRHPPSRPHPFARAAKARNHAAPLTNRSPYQIAAQSVGEVTAATLTAAMVGKHATRDAVQPQTRTSPVGASSSRRHATRNVSANTSPAS